MVGAGRRRRFGDSAHRVTTIDEPSTHGTVCSLKAGIGRANRGDFELKPVAFATLWKGNQDKGAKDGKAGGTARRFDERECQDGLLLVE